MSNRSSVAYQDSQEEMQTDKPITITTGEQPCFPDITFRRTNMIDKPMTTEELFNKIKSILKEKGKLPDILDYGNATWKPVPIRTYEFALGHCLDYGANEGIYLDLWIEYFVGTEERRATIGTFKTLYEDAKAMHTMAGLLADFIIEGHSYVNANLDDFTWEGVDVHALKENGEKVNWGYACNTMEAALRWKDELLENHQQVAVRDNATRKETIFVRQTEDIQNQENMEQKEGDNNSGQIK